MRFSTHRRSFLSRLVIMASALLILLMGAHINGLASEPPELAACGNIYKVDLTALTGTSCLPLSIHTVWGSTPPPVICPSFPQYTTPGPFFENPGVPFGTPLAAIEVCGQSIPPVAGYYPVNCAGGCTLCVAICFPSGCLVIKVVPGSCPNPSTTFPCP